MQALGQVAALRQQQALLRTHVQGEVALASSECTHQLESAQYKLRQKAMLMQGEAQGESLTIGKLQSYIGQVQTHAQTQLARNNSSMELLCIEICIKPLTVKPRTPCPCMDVRNLPCSGAL